MTKKLFVYNFIKWMAVVVMISLFVKACGKKGTEADGNGLSYSDGVPVTEIIGSAGGTIQTAEGAF